MGNCPACSPIGSLLPFSATTRPSDLASVEVAVVPWAPLQARCQNSQASACRAFLRFVFLEWAFPRKTKRYQAGTQERRSGSPTPGTTWPRAQKNDLHKDTVYFTKSWKQAPIDSSPEKNKVLTAAQPPICSGHNLQSYVVDTMEYEPRRDLGEKGGGTCSPFHR